MSPQAQAAGETGETGHNRDGHRGYSAHKSFMPSQMPTSFRLK